MEDLQNSEKVGPSEVLNKPDQDPDNENSKKEEPIKTIEPTSEVKSLQDSAKYEEQKMSIESKDEKEETQEIAGYEQVGGKEIYDTLIKSNLLCDHKVWKRVLREVKHVNENFQSLRTYIGVVADTI
jgi:hypothetical protein